MNKQNKNGGRGIEWTDYTWNPIGGCEHACRWEMPDGTIARCYAEAVAEDMSQAYRDGFSAHYWRPAILDEPLKLKTPAKIFLDSMSDLMKAKAPTEQVQRVLSTCRQAHWHTFQLLTKNAPRLRLFAEAIPYNVWVGASMPPDWFMGHRLTPSQQETMLEKALATLETFPKHITWMSFEPLSWDVSEIVARHLKALKWAVIGAASRGRNYFQPNPQHVANLLRVLEAERIPVFFKGNMDWKTWREEFPTMPTVDQTPPETSEQMSLF